MKKYVLIILSILTLINTTNAQKNLNSKQVKEDLSILGNIAIGLSPKLTEKDKSRIHQLIKLKKKELGNKTLSPIDFFKFLTTIDFETKFDEHASISFPEEVLVPLLSNGKLFPIPIKIIGQAAVTNTLSSEIPYASRIHAINGIPMDSLLRSFTKNFNSTHAKRRLEAQFSLMYLIMKGSYENFQIKFSPPSNPTKKTDTTINGIGFEKYRVVFSETVFPLEQSKLNNLINTHFYESTSTYYLQLNSFNWDNSEKKGLLHFLNAEDKKFDKRFDLIFQEILDRNADNLIIDLRFNSGGNVKVPGVLFSYIIKDPFTENIVVSIPDFEIPNPELVIKISGAEIQDSKEVQKFLRLYKKQFIEHAESGYLWNLVENKEVSPSKNSFNGNVYVLVSGRSISASAYFAALVKSYQRGLIVGEEMGGSYRALSAGQMLTYQLPHTKLELEVPIMEVNFSDQLYDSIKSNKISPDLLFNEKDLYQYFLEKRDIEIEQIMKLIESGGQLEDYK